MTDMATNIWCVRAHLLRATIMKKPSLLLKNVTEQYGAVILCGLPWNPWDIVLAVMFLGTPGFGILKRTNNLTKIDKILKEFKQFFRFIDGPNLDVLNVCDIRTIPSMKISKNTSPRKNVCTFTRFYSVEDHKILLIEESLWVHAFRLTFHQDMKL